MAMQPTAFMAAHYISEGKVQEALQVMMAFAEQQSDPALADAMLHIKGQWSKLQQDASQGLLSQADINLAWNSIVAALIGQKAKIKALETALADAAPVKDPGIEMLFQANAYASTERDLQGVMRTFHPEYPLFEQTQQYLISLFEQLPFDLQYHITRVQVLRREGDTAMVEVAQRTSSRHKAINFRENELVQVYQVKLHDGNWKIFGSAVKQITYFDV